MSAISVIFKNLSGGRKVIDITPDSTKAAIIKELAEGLKIPLRKAKVIHAGREFFKNTPEKFSKEERKILLNSPYFYIVKKK